MKYIFLATADDQDEAYDNCDLFRIANLATLADTVLQKLPDGRYMIVKGQDFDTIVRPENIYRLLDD